MAKTRILKKLFRGKAAVETRVKSAADIESWFRDRVARALHIESDKIDARRPFADYGLDSRTAVSISWELEEWLAREVPPTLVWDYPTIASASAFLAEPVSPENRPCDWAENMSDSDTGS